jgi:hypothetical protein
MDVDGEGSVEGVVAHAANEMAIEGIQASQNLAQIDEEEGTN